ncbi:MAG: amidase family protein [Pseudomonadota bacterium]|nr:amidase family protein [Pseudomonadota bacterium]
MRPGLFIGLLGTAGLLGCGASPSPAEPASNPPAIEGEFTWVEATVADVHDALAAGTLSCVDLVQGYLDRIAAYDRQGPTLNSVIAINPSALEDAAALDTAYAESGLTGPLHCAPVLLKDNFDAAGMVTSAGATALDNARPPDDAFSVAGIRAAGGLILGKANMDEFAFGFVGSSSMGGQVHNPYDPTRGAGGSSSGSGAAIAASLALIGTGSDTGGSIRVPSSLGGLVGIRPSLRLVSQDGILPLAHFQDVGGPMCRTVRDCALLLDAMVGFDPGPGSGQYNEPTTRPEDGATPVADAASYAALVGLPDAYADGLSADGLLGARIGIVRELFGSNADVIAVIDAALQAMVAAGATVEDVTIEDLDSITSYSSVSRWEFRDHMTEYLESWPSDEDGHLRSFEAVVASGGYENDSLFVLVLDAASGHTREFDPTYLENVRERGPFVRARLQAALDNRLLDGTQQGAAYDVLLYPSVLGLAPSAGSSPNTGSNNRLSPFSGFPAVSVPAGLAATDPALPVGMELLGREFDEARILRLAYAYEQQVAATPGLGRAAPAYTPELAVPH